MSYKSFMSYLWMILNHVVHTVECHYSAVQRNKILDMVWQWLRQNMHQRLYSQKTHHISPLQASYGVSFVRIWVKIDCVITTPRCIEWKQSLNGQWIPPNTYICHNMPEPVRKHPNPRIIPAQFWHIVAFFQGIVSISYLDMLTHCGLSDVIWRQVSRSTLTQVMACCLMAPSHFLNQCWVSICKV